MEKGGGGAGRYGAVGLCVVVVGWWRVGGRGELLKGSLSFGLFFPV